MSIVLDKSAILSHEEKLQDAEWFMEMLFTLTFSPGVSQSELDSNLTVLREAYREKSLDGVFTEFFMGASGAVKKSPEYEKSGLTLRMPYTKDDFLYTDLPYREIAEKKTAFARSQATAQLTEIAENFGIKGFKTLARQFDGAMETQIHEGRAFAFKMPDSDERVQIEPPPGWHIDGTGIYRAHDEYACTHPIAPIKRLRNIDTGMEKLLIAFERGGRTRYLLRDKAILSSAQKIIELSSFGVAVNSRTAPLLSQFLSDAEETNYDEMTEQESVSRLGWLDSGEFSPYMHDLAFDGEITYSTIFNAIKEQGSYEKWLSCAIECRKRSLTAQIELAASFASVLVKPLGCLPFFVHLWGVDSGTGKTVALMLAASVWGNPEIGQYPQTFNATQVGHEKTAAFLGSIPLCIDELQLSKDQHGRSRFDVYQLAQGVGRTRGNKGGGIDKTPTWALCILTTGESPIVQSNAGAGAVNRVIDIECKADSAVVKDGAAVCRIIRQNYGGAGIRFIEGLTSERLTQAQELYDKHFQTLTAGDTTEKQAMAAALILTADKLADDLIFKTGESLTDAQISDFLKTKASVSAGERGYQYMCDWVSINSGKFISDSSGESFGIMDGAYVYINRTAFRNACKDGGFDEQALLSWLKSKELIKTRPNSRAYTKNKRIGGIATECVVMQLQDVEDVENEDFGLL